MPSPPRTDIDDDWLEEGPVRHPRIVRAILRRPRDAFLIILGVMTIGSILVNGLFLQPGPHPAPIFPTIPRSIAMADATGTLTEPSPVAATPVSAVPPRSRAEIIADLQRELSRRSYYDGSVDGVYGAKTDAAIRDFEQSVGLKPSSEPSEALLQALLRAPAKTLTRGVPLRNDPIANLLTPSPRLLAVQRALSDFGYGQVKPSGMFDAATKAAIERFERERRLPITGDISDRFVRELAARTGRPLE
jgi:peptidoglycan hydrolase-like protein with peptidoglycan-binding domain